MPTERVRNQFEQMSSIYDRTRRNYIPEFDNFYGTGIEVLVCSEKSPRVLDVGGGTGIFTGHLLKKYPGARVTLIDFSAGMLKLAEKKYKDYPFVDTVCDDYLKHDYADEKFDIIISALSIHHFCDDDKRAVYEKMFSLLKQGGEFINADEVSGGDEVLDAKYLCMWKEFVESQVEPAEYHSFLQKIEIDIVAPMSLQLQWFKEIGFSCADCLFKYGTFAVMYGRK